MAFDTPLCRALPMRQVLRLVQEQRRRRGIDELWGEYIANVVPMLGGKDAATFAQVRERYESRTHVVTREEVAHAEDVGRSTAAAFGLL